MTLILPRDLLNGMDNEGSRNASIAEQVLAARAAAEKLCRLHQNGAQNVASTYGEVLGPLGGLERVIALVLSGLPPIPSLGRPNLEGEVWLEMVDALVTEPSNRTIADSGQLWNELLLTIDTDETVATQTAIDACHIGLYPLGLVDHRDLNALPAGRARNAWALVIGHQARSGFRTAESIARRCLADLTTPPDLCVYLTLGLGRCIPEDGIALLAHFARHSFTHRTEWQDAAQRMAPLARELIGSTDGWRQLIHSIFLGVGNTHTARQLLTDFLGETEEERQSLLTYLIEHWSWWPASLRAVILDEIPPGEKRTSLWKEDLSPAVLLNGIATADLETGPELRAFLVDFLLHPDHKVRLSVSKLLSERRKPSPVAQAVSSQIRADVVTMPMRTLTQDPLDQVRVSLTTEDPSVVPHLVEKLDDVQRALIRADLLAAFEVPDSALRRAAAESMALVAQSEDVPALLRILRRVRGLETLFMNSFLRSGCEGSLEELVELFQRRLKWADDEAVEHFIAVAGPQGPHELAAALETKYYPLARAGAARGLASSGFREAMFTLRQRTLVDPNPVVRNAALAALASFGVSAPHPDTIAGYALLVAPIDDLKAVTERAAAAGGEALPGLRHTLAHGSWRRRVAACEALALIAGDTAEEVLQKAVFDPDEDVRLSAYLALEEHGWSPKSVKDRTLSAVAFRKLPDLARTPDQIHLKTLEQCLEMGGHLFREEVGTLLMNLMDELDWRPDERTSAALHLSKLDAENALQYADGLSTLLRVTDYTWQLHPYRTLLTHGMTSVPASVLGEAAADLDLGWRAREAVCVALARPGDADAAQELERYIRDQDEDVRRACIEALVRVKSLEAAEVLASGATSPFQEDGDAVGRALAAIGTAALPVIGNLAESEWWEERRIAAFALQVWREDLQVATDRLLPLAIDAEYRVADTARRGLWIHGLRPNPSAIRETLVRAHTLSVSGMQLWFRQHSDGSLEDPQCAAALTESMQACPREELPYRIGLVATFRLYELADWLETIAKGDDQYEHYGILAVAASTLRRLNRTTCPSCEGKGNVACVRCHGDGEVSCQACDGRGVLRLPCPEPTCSARETTRSLNAPTCKTCRGRSVINETCECADGRLMCELCHGNGRTICLLCEGHGELTAIDGTKLAGS